MSKETAAKALGIILNCYPSQATKELTSFSRMALEALADEPDNVLMAMAHPRNGVVSKCKFLPSIAEMREWCQGERIRVAEIQREEDRQQLAGKRLPAPAAGKSPIVIGGFKNLLEEIKKSSRPHEPTKLELKELAEVWLTREEMRVAAGEVAPIKLSPAALATLTKGF